MTSSGEVVVVTGGSGFLGQHIVKALQERDEQVAEIRVLDIQPYTNKLGHSEKKPVKVIVGDVRNSDVVARAFAGADCVIHAAALISFGMDPDFEGMRQVNIKGTESVIEGCIRANVPRLVFTSTVDVVIGKEMVIHAKENQAPIPEKFLLPGYPETKYAAERKVIEANGRNLSNGEGVLHTVALRPVVMYGEGDPFFVVSFLRNAYKNGGVLLRIGSRFECALQQAYVGNVAWAHVAAKNALRDRPKAVAGLEYFVNDDTLPRNVFDFVEPFLVSRGLRVSSTFIPYWVIWIFLSFIQFLVTIFGSVYKPKLHMSHLSSVSYMCNTYIVNRLRATTRMRYSPIYSPEEAMTKAFSYYNTVHLS